MNRHKLLSILFVILFIGTAPIMGAVIDDLILKSNRIGESLAQYDAASQPTRNIISSPPSITTTLGMIGEGAQGRTRSEWLSKMGLSNRRSIDIGRGFSLLHSILSETSDNDLVLSSVNSIWIDQQRSINSSFIKYNTEYFETNVQAVNFKVQPITPIDKWVSQKTGNLLNRFSSTIAPDTSVLVLNTLQFKGKWARAFNPKRTDKRLFISPGYPPTLLPFMIQTGSFEYAETPTVQALILPYGDGRFEMLIVSPYQWSSTNLPLDWISETPPVEFETTDVTVVMPKFKVRAQTSLKAGLSSVGFSALFADTANFSGIHSTAKLTDIVQQIIIDVDERGTEAAAATGGSMSITSLSDKKTASVILTRPFLYVIRDTISGVYLFIGTYTSPSE